MIIQMKQKTKFWKIWPCTFKWLCHVLSQSVRKALVVRRGKQKQASKETNVDLPSLASPMGNDLLMNVTSRAVKKNIVRG